MAYASAKERPICFKSRTLEKRVKEMGRVLIGCVLVALVLKQT